MFNIKQYRATIPQMETVARTLFCRSEELLIAPGGVNLIRMEREASREVAERVGELMIFFFSK